MKNNNIHFPHHPFDYNYLIDQLKNYHFPRNKIQKLMLFMVPPLCGFFMA
jgi:hypothetical protein